MRKGHVHSFVSMVKKYSMFKNAHISNCGTILIALIDVSSDVQYIWKHRNTLDVSQYDTAMLVYWYF